MEILIKAGVLLFGLIFAGVYAHATDFNVRFSPVGMIGGLLNAELDIPVSDSLAIGPEFGYLHGTIHQKSVHIVAYGLRGVYYFNESVFTDGWYFSPGVTWSRVRVGATDAVHGPLTANGESFALSLISGYQWFWDYFNIALGGGLAWSSIGTLDLKSEDGVSRDTYKGPGTRAALALEFSLGFTF